MAKYGSSYITEIGYGKIVDENSFVLLESTSKYAAGEQQTSPIIKTLWNNGKNKDHNVLITYYTETPTTKETLLVKKTIIHDIKLLDNSKLFSVVLKSIGPEVSSDKMLLIAEAIVKAFSDYNVQISNEIVLNTLEEARAKYNVHGTIIVNNVEYQKCLGFRKVLSQHIQFEFQTEKHYIIIENNDSLIESCNVIPIGAAKKVDSAGVIDEWIDNYYIPVCVRTALPAVQPIIEHEKYLNIFVRGESGSGKTTFAEMLARHLGFEYGSINSQMITDPESWFGKRGAADGTTYTAETNFAKLLQQGNTVILIDEVNRLASDLTNPLMPMLDDRRCFEFDGEFFDVAPGTIFVLSANIGYQYAGTFALDAAFTNRAQIKLHFSDLPDEILTEIIKKRFAFSDSEAKEVFDNFNRIRAIIRNPELSMVDIDTSVRALINFARLVKYGLSQHDAIVAAIIAEINEDEYPKGLQEALYDIQSMNNLLPSINIDFDEF